ncbi:hypothetical protein KC973_01625 [Candidatus Saccharibacteria bacterium]|nr:hypothetical protein [Candidatus Saccharibacteria bacterium]
MNKRTKIALLVSLAIGLGISTWTGYFINYSYEDNNSSGLAVDCTEPRVDGDEACILPTDYETSGTPLQFKRADWQYVGGLNGAPEQEQIYIDYNFSWPLFIANSIIWAALPFGAWFFAQKFMPKTKHKK